LEPLKNSYFRRLGKKAPKPVLCYFRQLCINHRKEPRVTFGTLGYFRWPHKGDWRKWFQHFQQPKNTGENNFIFGSYKNTSKNMFYIRWLKKPPKTTLFSAKTTKNRPNFGEIFLADDYRQK
jgi:hypothetical protein